jgi:hypothetical protein
MSSISAVHCPIPRSDTRDAVISASDPHEVRKAKPAGEGGLRDFRDCRGAGACQADRTEVVKRERLDPARREPVAWQGGAEPVRDAPYRFYGDLL